MNFICSRKLVATCSLHTMQTGSKIAGDAIPTQSLWSDFVDVILGHQFVVIKLN